MATYLGFSTQNVCKAKTTNMVSGSAGGPGGIRSGIIWGKKFKLTDNDLVIQDLINGLNIRRGTKVGQPGYGTTLWDKLFEQNTPGVQSAIETEIRRLIAQDPRIIPNIIKVYPYENGILVELQLAVAPLNQALAIKINLNLEENTATLV